MDARSETREATLKDVVAATGIPLNTVARILGGRITRIGARTRARIELVEAAAARLGYRPHLGARSMRSGRLGTIGLVIGTDQRGSFLPRELLDGIVSRLEQDGSGLSIMRMSEQRLDDPAYLPGFLASRSCDGVLINHLIRLPEALTSRIAAVGMPCQWINAGTLSGSVGPDDADAGSRAATHLLELGHRRIAFAAGFPLATMLHESPARRLEGVRLALQGRGRLTRWVPDAVLRNETALDFWSACLGAADRPTAVITYSHQEVAAIMLAACRLGLHVPRDLSLVAITELSTLADLQVQPTAVLLPWHRIGQRAAEQLLGRMQTPSAPPGPAVALPCSLLPGVTTAAIPA